MSYSEPLIRRGDEVYDMMEAVSLVHPYKPILETLTITYWCLRREGLPNVPIRLYQDIQCTKKPVSRARINWVGRPSTPVPPGSTLSSFSGIHALSFSGPCTQTAIYIFCQNITQCFHWISYSPDLVGCPPSVYPRFVTGADRECRSMCLLGFMNFDLLKWLTNDHK